MNAKLRGSMKELPALTRLKVLWRDSLTDEQREFWRGQLTGTATQAELRRLILREHGIELRRDSQLTDFREWLQEQDERDREAERQEEDSARLAEAHPEWDADRLRSEVIAASMRRAIATGDFKGLGLKAVKAGQNEQRNKLDERRITLLEEKAKQADSAEQIAGSALSDAEKVARMKQVFGMS